MVYVLMTSRSEAGFFRAEDAYQAYQLLCIPTIFTDTDVRL